MTETELKQEFINKIYRRLQLSNTADDVYKLAKAYSEIMQCEWQQEVSKSLRPYQQDNTVIPQYVIPFVGGANPEWIAKDDVKC